MKVHIEFDSDGINELDALKKQDSVKTRTDIIKNAVGVFSWIVQQVDDGFSVIAIREDETHGRELCLPILEKIKKKSKLQPSEYQKLISCGQCREQIPVYSAFCPRCGCALKKSVERPKLPEEPSKKPSLGRGIIDTAPGEKLEELVTAPPQAFGECPLCGKEITGSDKSFKCEVCNREHFCEEHFQTFESVCLDCLAKLDDIVNIAVREEDDNESGETADNILSEMEPEPVITPDNETYREDETGILSGTLEHIEIVDNPLDLSAPEIAKRSAEEKIDNLYEVTDKSQTTASPASPAEDGIEFDDDEQGTLANVEIVSGKSAAVEPLDQAPLIKPVKSEIVIIEGTEMILVPGGEFIMGNDKGYKDEGPTHKVFLTGYYIDRFPVTNKQFKEYLKDTDAEPPRNFWDHPDFNHDDQPVIGVNWDEAKAYCNWAGKRLPTEAEWEKAARGTDARQYPWGNEWEPNRCNSLEIGVKKTTVVDAYPNGVSPYGVMDLAGNVYEWCEDWYDEMAYQYSTYKNPTGPKFGTMKILRGGSWSNLPGNIRVTFRLKSTPDRHVQTFGFRCVKPVD